MRKRTWLIAVAVLATSTAAFAQATANINGRVLDQGGAVLPGASVTIIDASTSVERSTITNGEGLYTVPALNAGTYKVRVDLPGFAPAIKNNITLLTGATLSVDLQLGIAAVEENVTVSGQSPLVEVTQAVLANSIQLTEVQELPMLNRSLGAMITLLPGAREVGTSGTSAHGTSSSYVSFGGGGGRNYNMLVDGIDNKEDNCGGTMVVYSLEGVREMKVISTGASAEYGRGTTTILLATKSGGNLFKGSLFGYFRNDSLVRTDYFADPAHGGFGKAPVNRHQDGGALGGPLLKDHAWFFGSVERVAQQYKSPRNPSAVKEFQILAQALPNNDVRVNPFLENPSRDTLGQAKFNVQLSAKHSGWVRYSSEYGYIDTGSTLTWTDVNNRNHQSIWNMAGGETWVISPTTVNEFTTQWIEFTHDSRYPTCPLDSTWLGVNLGPNNCLRENLSFPSVTVGTGNIFPLWTDLDNKLEFKDDFSKQMGRHAFKTGVGYLKMPLYGGIFGSPNSSMAFFDDPSVITSNSNGKYPQGFLTPGIVRTLTLTTTTIGDYSTAQKGMLTGGPTPCQANATVTCGKNDWGSPDYNLGVYVQDDYKLSPRVTLNLGIRYDKYNYIGSQELLLNNRAVKALQAIGSPYGGAPKPDANNWGPRAGFAWDLFGTGTDVVRGSYGLYYVQILNQSTYQRNFLSQSILQAAGSTQNSAVGSGALANFVYGVTPIAAPAAAPTSLPAGGRTTGYVFDPNMEDAQSHQLHGGWSHAFPRETVLAADYTHMIGQKGLRAVNINPLLSNVRPLTAALQTTLGDPNLLGPVQVQSSVNRSRYDELAVHFERRFAKGMGFQTNYTLAYARGMGGVVDGTTSPAAQAPQIASATGGLIDVPYEWGPSAYDERHRVVVAGSFELPFSINVAPSFTMATARPYTQVRANNPSGDGSLDALCPSGDNADIGFGVGQVSCGPNNARGAALYNFNARVTKNLSFSSEKKMSIFLELYNLIDHANFGNVFGGNAATVLTYNKPTGYIGGTGAVSTIANSFQAQVGARFSF